MFARVSDLKELVEEGQQLLGEAAPRIVAVPRFKVGDRIAPLVSHMAGMKNRGGTIAIVRTAPAYYGVKFDGQKDVHKWFAEDELKKKR